MYSKEKIFKYTILGAALVMGVVMLITQSLYIHGIIRMTDISNGLNKISVNVNGIIRNINGNNSITDSASGNTAIASLSFVIISILMLIVVVENSVKNKEITKLSLFLILISILIIIMSFALVVGMQGNDYQNLNLLKFDPAMKNAARAFPVNMAFIITGSVVAIGSGIGLYKVTH